MHFTESNQLTSHTQGLPGRGLEALPEIVLEAMQRYPADAQRMELGGDHAPQRIVRARGHAIINKKAPNGLSTQTSDVLFLAK